MVKMLDFLFIIVELSCETSHSPSNSTDKERAMHYGSEIDDYGAKISHYHYFSAGGCEHREIAIGINEIARAGVSSWS